MIVFLNTPFSPTTGAGASASPSAVKTCTKERLFLVVHCHPGWKWDLGSALENSAQTHVKEIKTNSFPNLPVSEYNSTCDTVRTIYCNNVKGGPVGGVPNDRAGRGRDVDAINNYTASLESIINGLVDDSLFYLAIFAHSGWLGVESGIFFHPTSETWANFTGSDVSILKRSKFMAGSQVRIFGCFAGYGTNSIAEQIANHLPSTDVYAYNWQGGSFGTNDKEIGHGKKNVPKSPLPPKNGDTWFVTFSPGKKSSFQKF